MTVALCIIIVLLLASIYFNVKFLKKLMAVRDTIEECLDIIDEKYARMSEILARPLFYDSPEVKKVVNDIKATRVALHRIAYQLDNSFDGELDEDGNARTQENQETSRLE